jgi:hypothetical protein
VIFRTYLLTYLLRELSPSWEAANCAAIQEIPSNFKEPRRFSTVFTRALHWSLSRASSIQPETENKQHLFPDISSINTDTIVSSLYQCAETRSIEVFWLLSQPLPHQRFNLFVISETFATQLWTTLRGEHFQPYAENIYLWISFALSPFAHTK